MANIGTVESVWRYPVKSMRGAECAEIFAGFSGVYGDRMFAFQSSANRKDFPHFTVRDQRDMLRYRPRFRYPEKSVVPPNLVHFERNSPGANPVYADPADMMLDVQTPDGQTFAIDDPALIESLRTGVDPRHQVTLIRSDRAITDCRPLSLFSLQTARQLAVETGVAIDKRRFRANVYLDLASAEGFAEDRFVGRSLRLGEKAVVSVLERDPRCSVITIDPDTGEKLPALLKSVAQAHGGDAGIYGAILVEGVIRQGDSVELLD